jgi:predicted DCC family thiol-disulfide oxidoreductase YuxK
MDETTESAPVLLYDGVCGFCNKSVQTIIAHDRRGVMRFAALQSEYARSVIARHPQLKGIDSMVLIERSPETGEERVYVRSASALRVASYLGGFWKLLLAFKVVPAPIRDYFYDTFARHRYRLFGRHDACLLPPPEVRARFIDV